MLEEIRAATGMSVSSALKQGLMVLRAEVARQASQTPYDIYSELDLGPGAYSIASASRTREGGAEGHPAEARQVILVDTGPLIALFDPRDAAYDRCRRILQGVREPLYTTVPVLTEAFHILTPASIGSARLRDFIVNRGLSVWYFADRAPERAFELMEQYSDHPMDLADASLVVAAETLKTRKIYTIDRRDFDRYRLKHGHRHVAIEVLT